MVCAAGHEMKAQYCGGVLCPKGHTLILDLVPMQQMNVEKRGGKTTGHILGGQPPS